MKKVFTVVFILCCLSLYAQDDAIIEVSFDKSVVIIFGAANDPGAIIDKTNCGSPEAVGLTKSNNLVFLQANEEHFNETNLFVSLKNGEIFVFILKYNNTPKKLRYNVPIGNPEILTAPVVVKQSAPQSSPELVKPVKETKDKKQEVKIVEQPVAKSEVSVEDHKVWAKRFSEEKDYLSRLAVVHPKFIFYVGGIWVQDDKIYFKINLANQSPISYDIGSHVFYIKKDKSSSAQQIKPLYVFNDENSRVDAKSIGTYVAVFDKFFIGDNTKFIIEYWEKGGESNFELKLQSKELLNAKVGI